MIWLPPQGNFCSLDALFHFIAVLTVCLDDRRYSVDKGHRNIQNKEHGARNVLGGRVWQALVARVNTPVAWDLARFGIFHGLFGSWEGQNRMPLHNGTRAGTERIGRTSDVVSSNFLAEMHGAISRRVGPNW